MEKENFNHFVKRLHIIPYGQAQTLTWNLSCYMSVHSPNNNFDHSY